MQPSGKSDRLDVIVCCGVGCVCVCDECTQREQSSIHNIPSIEPPLHSLSLSSLPPFTVEASEQDRHDIYERPRAIHTGIEPAGREKDKKVFIRYC